MIRSVFPAGWGRPADFNGDLMTAMVRRAYLAVGLAFLAMAAVLSTPLDALAQANVNSASKYSAIVIDANSGEVLYAKRADSQRYPASITKVMTLYLTFEALAQGRLSMDEQIPVSKHAASQQPTKLGLAAGSTISVSDAIQAIAIQSANDMAVAMAERLGGTESRFGTMMTLRAQELGMVNSRFVNASGLPDSRQISSARDLAILSRAVMRDYPQYYAYFGQQQFNYQGKLMTNHNHLLMQMQGVDGLKTGFTSASGYNLAASAVRGDRRLIAVVLGGTSNASRDSQVRNLLETGFEVVRRRQNGEKIVIAQDLFEPPSTEYARVDTDMTDITEAVEEGDDDDDGGYVRVSTPAVAAPTPAVSRPTAAPRPAAATPRDMRPSQKSTPAGRHIVQVGAFKDRSAAQTQIKEMNRRFGQYFADAESEVGDKVGGFFRARFTGFTADAAKAACAALKAKKQTCAVIAP
jgi:D-alanyl-D-alanine carboxypeptidase (penicillin-binding protein 5/6)